MLKRVLITGGAGFIGSHLTERLLVDGYEVVTVDALTDYYDSTQKLQNLKSAKPDKNFKFYKTNILQKTRLRNIFAKEKPEIVIHLASEVGVRPSIARPADYIEVNVVGTHNLLELAREFKIKQFIFGSSSSIYGKRSGKRGFVETDMPSPISPYAATKRSAELMCQVYATESAIKFTVLRFFTVYGPRNRPDMASFQFTDAIFKGRGIEIYGRGTKRDFTFVDDIVDGIVRAISKPFGFEVINLGNSSPVAVLYLIKLIEKSVGRKANISRRKLPPGDVPVTFANIAKAKKLLGWSPKSPIEKGVEMLVNWYKIHSKL